MADITSGTSNFTPLGDFIIGTLELAPTADDADNVGVQQILGRKIEGIVYANGVRNATQSGSVDISPISFNASSGTITIGYSGTQGGIQTNGIDDGRTSLSNYRRDIFFVAISKAE